MTQTAQIVIIEDDDGNRRSLTRALTRAGYAVEAFEGAEPALAYLAEHSGVRLVLTDLMLPGVDGFGVLQHVRDIDSGIGIVMITGHGSVESAVDAMKRGADDYLTKPVNLDELRICVARVLDKHRAAEQVVDLQRRLNKTFNLVGESKAMKDLYRQMELVANARSNALIVGDSGTGKELVANALHDHSPRRDKRFLPINCAAIPAEILESELFGHERGAFTGATGRKIGKFELADGGTLFLDEIGELPIEMQVKLLRVLEQREFMRVGGSETIHVDIRLVAASNRDLEALVEQNRFRSDLYYRLKVVTLKIPPLRDREGDIHLLATHFLRLYAEENNRPELRFSPEAMSLLVAARWEGNVRELRNVVESLVVLVPGDLIRAEDLPEELRESPPAPRRPAEASASSPELPVGGENMTMDEIERRAILAALEKTGGNRTQAAEMLGIGLRTLQRKLKEYKMAGRGAER